MEGFEGKARICGLERFVYLMTFSNDDNHFDIDYDKSDELPKHTCS